MRKRLTRRGALSTAGKVAVGVVVAGVIAGVGGYYAGSATAPNKTTTETKTVAGTTVTERRTVTTTVTKSVTVTTPTIVTQTQTPTTTTPTRMKLRIDSSCPLGSTTVPAFYMYKQAMEYFQLGYASAIGVFIFIINMIIIAVLRKMGGGLI